MARTFTADGAPLNFIGKRETAELVKAATVDSRKRAKRTKKLQKRVEALLADVGPIDPIKQLPTRTLAKRARDPRSWNTSRDRAVTELQHRLGPVKTGRLLAK